MKPALPIRTDLSADALRGCSIINGVFEPGYPLIDAQQGGP